jgi:hypothetical protein
VRAKRIVPTDPWNLTLDIFKGRLGLDGVERICPEMVFEWLDVPPFRRTPEMAERIRHSMVRRGWVQSLPATPRARAMLQECEGMLDLRRIAAPNTAPPSLGQHYVRFAPNRVIGPWEFPLPLEITLGLRLAAKDGFVNFHSSDGDFERDPSGKTGPAAYRLPRVD